MSSNGRKTSRREFIARTATGVAGLGLATTFGGALEGCATTTRVHGACHHDCPDTCAWVVTTQKGKAIKLEGDKLHPMTRGELCGKMSGYLTDVVSNPDRVLYPMKRVGPKGEGRLERVSWDVALGEVAERLQKIIAESGATAILPYSFDGTQGIVQSASIDRRFFGTLGASRLVRGVCGATGYMGIVSTMGTFGTMLPEDIVHSKLIIVWGANPVRTNAHLWPLVEEARSHGARLVVIDPLKTETAARADQHIQPLPGTDTALALGMMHVIVKEGLHDAAYVKEHTYGFESLSQNLQVYPPERVATLTGLKVSEIVELARAYAKVRPAAIRTLVGLEHHGGGGMTFRTIACLPALVGAWRDRGGGLLHMTADLFEEALKPVSMPELTDHKIRSINMVQIGRALTDKTLAPPVRALVVYNSNPAAIAPNQSLVLEGLKREDLLTVVLEQFVTDTARYADYVFPATTQVEHLDLMTSWGHRHVALNRPAVAPAGESAPNTEFFRRLARRMGRKESYLYDTDEQIVRAALASDHPYLKGITFERLWTDGWAPLALPEPWLPFAKGGYPTASKKCELYSEGMLAHKLDPLPNYEPPDEAAGAAGSAATYPLHFLSTKSSRNFLNSSHSNQPRQMKAEGPPRLEMNAEDATPRGIRDGDLVRVWNEQGSLQVRAAVKDNVRSRVVSLPHGWWASRMPGARWANVLTPDGLTDMGGGGAFHDAKVQVELVKTG